MYRLKRALTVQSSLIEQIDKPTLTIYRKYIHLAALYRKHIHLAALFCGFVMIDAISISSIRNSGAIGFEPLGNSAGAAASPASAAKRSQAAAKAMQLDRSDAEACGDKRWVGASVCLGTAVTSALLLMWLTLHLAR